MQSSLAIYLHDIGQYPLLNAEQELELGRRIKEENDEEARQTLINSNLRLVVSVAKPFHNAYTNMSLEDLILEGTTGLITAVDKYDYTYGYRFSTCAVPWIKQAIMKAIADKSRTIRIPAHIIQMFNKYKKAIESLESRFGDQHFTNADIAKEMGVEEADVENIVAWKQNTVSINTPLGDEDEDTLEDLQADLHDESPVEYTEKQMRHEAVELMLADLPDRTKTIMKMRYGLGTEDDPEEFRNEHTLEEIGAYLGITRERVRQIEKQTLQELKVKYGKMAL